MFNVSVNMNGMLFYKILLTNHNLLENMSVCSKII